MTRSRIFRQIGWLVFAWALLGLWASATDAAYPDRPVKLIVPWAAGGDTDAIMRVIADALEKPLGQPMVVVNITGASGTVGAREAKAAAPDGYTLYSVHDYIHTTFYTGVSNISYKDFEPICLCTETPSMLAAYTMAPWSTLKDMLAYAKQHPEEITVGATLGSTSHFFPAMLAQAAGVKFKYVSYEGTAPRMTALMGGHLMLGETNLTQIEKVKAGHMKILAVATEKRLPDLPDVPTFKELGFDIEYAVNRGLMAPKGTPESILTKLEGACSQAMQNPKVADSMKMQGTFVEYKGRKAYAEFLQKNDKDNAVLAAALGYTRK
ncbi:MAG TPA: tripartite tricarboxylate transporter substrate binding protein [Candidatus Methylomirabilis sp.]|nr:tripartite tricarboxylate transporter substrate binding protein [Candidatus Methylomirabilis sp.]HSC69847.1 tripartite tricarboxylate transporter substrate binding protein [Candidatus Methylomirabilis sp.]